MATIQAESWAKAKVIEGGALCAVSTSKNSKDVYALLRVSPMGYTPSLLIALTGEADSPQGDLAYLNYRTFQGLGDVTQACNKIGLIFGTRYPHPQGFEFLCTTQGTNDNLSIAILAVKGRWDDELEFAASLIAIPAITAVSPLTTTEG